MRYEGIDIIVFTNTQGKVVSLKDMREYEDFQTLISLPINEGMKFDEVASRQEIYGDDGEMDSYKIFDHNKVLLFENSFDVSKLKRLSVPL